MLKLSNKKRTHKNKSSEKKSKMEYNKFEKKIDSFLENMEEDKTRKTGVINQKFKNKKMKNEINNKVKSKNLRSKKSERQPKKINNKKKKKDHIESKKKKSNIFFYMKKAGFRKPKKITLKRIIWILILFCITITMTFYFFIAATGRMYVDTLYVSIFIGIMVIREAIDEFVPAHYKKTLNLIMSVFIIMFFLIVINEMINLISR